LSLILALVNRENAILASDRRLVFADGFREDESNKAGLLVCRDARLCFAFTGLAKYGRFQTKFWLLEALSNSAQPDFLMAPLLYRFREYATKRLTLMSELNEQQKRMTVVFAGYSYADATPRAYVWRISNFEIGKQGISLPEAQEDFEAHFWRDARLPEEPLSAVMAYGTTDGIKQASIRELI
jgi:hypothetical protein